ncbi:MAG: hypothetical protein WAU21_02595 [Chitinophagales bacterium]
MSKSQVFTTVYLILISSVFYVGNAHAQGTQVQFGQNRVQYKEFLWQFYESDHFKIYFNQGGQNIGRFVAQMAENDLDEIQDLLDYKLNVKPELMIYNTMSDFNQSNFAIGNEITYNIGGHTKIIGNKLFLYFDGDHQHLRTQIREGLGKMLISSMIFGGSLQEIVQNAVLLNLPDWFVDGLASYIGEEWSTELDNELREGITSGKFEKFSKLTGDDARFAGHSFWYYIAEKYGEANIPNLLYLIRINRSLENGFLFVLGTSVNQTIADWYAYYSVRYAQEAKGKEVPQETRMIERKSKKNLTYHHARISPDGKNIAYVTDDFGKFKVYVQPVDDKKAKKIKKGGLKTHIMATDLNYPLVIWSPDGKVVGVIYEKRARTFVMTYNIDEKKKEEKEITRFQRITDASFGKDNRTIVLSAINKGQSDIYVYYLNNARLEQITNDYYDDANPRFIKTDNGYEGILFASNRDSKKITQTSTIDTILPVGNMDLFFYKYNTKSDVLIKITETHNVTESAPIQIDKTHFAYLSDQNGIVNRFAGYLDTVYTHTNTVVYFKDSTIVNPKFDISEIYTQPDFDSIGYFKMYKDTAYTFAISNYTTNILEHDASMRTGKILEVFQSNGATRFYIAPVPKAIGATTEEQLFNTSYRNFIDEKNKKKNSKQTEIVLPNVTEYINTDTTSKQSQVTGNIFNTGMLFQSDFAPPAKKVVEESEVITLDKSVEEDKNNLITENAFKQTRIQGYRLKFSSEYVLTQLDNGLFINKYQNFTTTGGTFENPVLSGLLAMSISDLFEDYRFTGGFRFPTTFDGGEYFVQYEDLKHRWDKRLTYYYHYQREQYTFQPVWFPVVDSRNKTNIVEGSLKYPIDISRSIRGSVSYRADKVIFLAGDTFSLNQPNYKEDWLTFKLEYVFDNTFPVMTNILNGTRYKFWFEIHKQFSVNTDQGIDVSFNDGYLGVIGVDFRHYQKIHRSFIWANRIAGGLSFGTQKMIYYLGGVDSWIAPVFNENTQINYEQNYAFQTVGTPVRGYEQNIRNGNAFAVFNSELRFPVFSYLINKPIKAQIVRNFQVVGFFDAGTAWEGKSPFNQENPYNSVNFGQPPLDVDVNFFRDPVVAGFGWGLRTTIFGYFLRLDRARGIEINGLTKGYWYFSLSLDF